MPRAKIPLVPELSYYRETVNIDLDSGKYRPRLINAVVDKSPESSGFEVCKRDGLKYQTVTGTLPEAYIEMYPSHLRRVLFVVGPTNELYYINDTHAINRVQTTPSGNLTMTHNGRVFFSDNLLSNETLVVPGGNSAGAFVINASLVGSAVDTLDATVTQFGAAHLNGYNFVMDVNKTIYNSELAQAGVWDMGLNFIQVTRTADRGTAITDYNQHIVVFGEYSTNFLYDAAIVEGSPLDIRQDVFFDVGCSDVLSIAKGNQNMCWLGKDKADTYRVWMLAGFQLQEISTPDIRSIVNRAYEGTNVQASGHYVHLNGHLLYTLYIQSDQDEVCLAFDMDTAIWSVLESNKLNSFKGHSAMALRLVATNPFNSQVRQYILPIGYENVINNNSFESGALGPHSFSGVGASDASTVQDVGAAAYHGSHVLSQNTATQSADWILNWNGAFGNPALHAPTSPGERWRSVSRTRLESGVSNNVRVEVNYRDSDGGSLGSTNGTYSTAVDGWGVRQVTSGPAPANTSHVLNRYRIQNNGNSGAIWADFGELYNVTGLLYFDPLADEPVRMYAQLPRFRGQPGEETISKFGRMLRLVGNTETTPENLTVRWADTLAQLDSAPVSKTIPLAGEKQGITRLGRFVNRIHSVEITTDKPIRIEALEMDYDVGVD